MSSQLDLCVYGNAQLRALVSEIVGNGLTRRIAGRVIQVEGAGRTVLGTHAVAITGPAGFVKQAVRLFDVRLHAHSVA